MGCLFLFLKYFWNVYLNSIPYKLPEELHFQHPYLTLGQIYSALAYYWDHQDTLDAEIEQRLKFVDQLKSKSKPTPLVKRLKAQGLL